MNAAIDIATPTASTPVPAASVQAPQRLLVLMYHGLHAAPGDSPRYDPRYSVDPQAFDRQMERVRALRGEAWVPGQAAAGGASAVMVSFDDGAASDASLALPCLQAHGLRATFFVTSGFVGAPGMLSLPQLRALSEAGMVIGAHGATHRFLSTLSAADLREELRGCRARLQDWTGQPVDTLALPGGRGGERERAAAREAGFRWVFGSEPGVNRGLPDDRILRRVAITRGMGPQAFEQVLGWQGAAVRQLRMRHRVLSVPRRLLGDDRYDRLREALVR